MARGSVLLAMAVALLALAGGRGVAAAPVLPPETMCAVETARNEQLYGIPPQLLESISLVESGRYDQQRRAKYAWPWTINAEGEGRFFATKAEAVAEAKRLKARGVKSFDVGCMQVNMHHHAQAFDSLEEAFEPAANVAYAARFLKGLYAATSHWPTAASYYHSQTPHLAAIYREKLMKVWAGAGEASARTALASIKPVPPAAQLRPVPSNPKVEEMRKAWRDQTAANRSEARRIADAYRQARLVEYQMRRARMAEARRAAGLPADGY